MAVKPVTREEEIRADIKRLHAMGYAQELYRAMGGFSNFAISFTIISILSGCVTLFYLIPTTVGFSAAAIGWPLVTVFVVIVGLGMAELASAFPTAGGLYFWSSKLGGPAWGWYTGWFNLIGQVAVTAGIDYGAAVTIDVLLHSWFPSIPATPGSVLGIDAATQWTTLLIYAIILALHALLNIFGVRIVAFLNDVSVWWHIAGVAVIVGGIIIATVASQQFDPGAAGVCCATQVTGSAVQGFNSAGTLFTPDNGFNLTGFPLWYALLLSLLLAQYTYTGYDASAHMTEETVGAATRAPWGVVMSIVVSAIAGYALLMGLSAATPDLAKAGGFVNPVLYILESRFSYVLGTILFAVIAVAQFFCGMSSVTSNSRMIYAFSRDGAVPFHHVWHRLDRGRTPRNAILLAVVCSFILAIPSVWNFVAYVAVTSVAVIGLYIAYALPILLRLFAKDFQRGPWHLGAWSKPIGWIAVIWVALISILFMLPTANPITGTNFNYTPVVVLGTILIITLWWLISARHWFKGPVAQGTEAQLEAIEAEFGETLGIQSEAAPVTSRAMSDGVAMAMEADGAAVASASRVEVATLERVEMVATEVREVKMVQTETVTEEVVTEAQAVRLVERQTASGRIISEFERDFSGHIVANEVHVEEKETRAREHKVAEKKPAKKKIISEFERDFGGKETS